MCHRDNNPRNNCADNLYWGTCKDNLSQASREGRMVRGERQHSAKLTSTDVKMIRKQLARGVSNRQLSHVFKVVKSTIQSIRSNKTWRHVQ